MNWNQYFKLREKQKKHFLLFFLLLFLMNLFYYTRFSLTNSTRVWEYYLFYSPLFILTDIAGAYVLAWFFWRYDVYKSMHRKENAGEGDGKERKEEEKEKK